MVDEGPVRIVLPVGTVDICTVSYTKSYMNERDAQHRGDLHKLRYIPFLRRAIRLGLRTRRTTQGPRLTYAILRRCRLATQPI
jgi:hypothetical protein